MTGQLGNMRQDDGGSVPLCMGWSGKATLMVQSFQKDCSSPWPFFFQSLGTAKNQRTGCQVERERGGS